jgi:hypothetical protein
MVLSRRLQPTTSMCVTLFLLYIISRYVAGHWMLCMLSPLDRATSHFGSQTFFSRIRSKYEHLVVVLTAHGILPSILATRYPSICRTDSRVSCTTTGQLALVHKSRASNISLLCWLSFSCKRGVTTCEYVLYIRSHRTIVNNRSKGS